MNTRKKISVYWFRRDLRLEDNHGLNMALKSSNPVLALFIYDEKILQQFVHPQDPRFTFIEGQLNKITTELMRIGSSLLVMHGKPKGIFQILCEKYDIRSVYCNQDYDSYSRSRDQEIQELCQNKKISFHSIKDHVIFEKNEILNQKGNPYLVFTAYKKRWLEKLTPSHYQKHNTSPHFSNFLKTGSFKGISIEKLGYQRIHIDFPETSISQNIIHDYEKNRDTPAIEGTSRIGIHLRFGTISVRSVIRATLEVSAVFLNQLIWRDFFNMILWHFPHVEIQSFKSIFDRIPWENDEQKFEAWCEGKTGFPLVDAGMRQLKQTGYMHNRVRMLTASFLVKDLHIDWRWGEAYFAQKLLDFDLALNNGNWQWAAGSGCDAAPYFRIFNPERQQKRFDPEFKYIRKWIPEFNTTNYTKPIVNHKTASAKFIQKVRELKEKGQ